MFDTVVKLFKLRCQGKQLNWRWKRLLAILPIELLRNAWGCSSSSSVHLMTLWNTLAHFHIVVMVGTCSGFVLDSFGSLGLLEEDVHWSVMDLQLLVYQSKCLNRFRYHAIRQITDFVQVFAYYLNKLL